MAQVARPAEKLFVICESDQTPDVARRAPMSYNYAGGMDRLSDRHDMSGERVGDATGSAGPGTALFADGHADFVPRGESVNPRYRDGSGTAP